MAPALEGGGSILPVSGCTFILWYTSYASHAWKSKRHIDWSPSEELINFTWYVNYYFFLIYISHLLSLPLFSTFSYWTYLFRFLRCIDSLLWALFWHAVPDESRVSVLFFRVYYDNIIFFASLRPFILCWWRRSEYFCCKWWRPVYSHSTGSQSMLVKTKKSVWYY